MARRRSLLRLICAIVGTVLLAPTVSVGQCSDGSTALWASRNVVRQAGNQVWEYAQSWVEGNYYLYWIPRVTGTVTLNGQIHYGTNTAGYGGIATTQWYDAPSSVGVGLYTIYGFHEYGSDCGQYQYQNTVASLLVERPTISGPNATWWLGGGSDPANGYYNAATLTADPKGAPETPYWSVTANPSKVSLSCSVCTNSVVASAQPSAGCQWDVAIKISVGGLDSNLFNFQVNQPSYLVSSRQPVDTAQGGGWYSKIYYNTKDMCSNYMSSIALNESFGGWVNDQANNWSRPTAGGAWGFTDYEWFDGIWLDCATCTPPTMNPQTPLSASAVDHVSQSWRMGSAVVGSGVLVQTNVFQRYLDHARHQ